ncbi:hypothetical protein V2W45_1417066 [Cenococcum geophilum]
MANLASTLQVMETGSGVLGEEHPSTLTSTNSLAFTLRSQSRNKEAILLIEKCFQLRKRALGPQHPHTTSLKALNEWQMENIAI